MNHRFSRLSLLAAISSIAILAMFTAPSIFAQGGTPAEMRKTEHKVAIQVNDNDARVMNLALNNANNIAEYYKKKGERVVVEVVTFGPGLHMLRADTSPVKSRIAQMSLEIPAIKFAACANTQANMAKQEGKDISLISEASIVPSGVVQLMELQERGFAYLRP